jgi:hypothetical protein
MADRRPILCVRSTGHPFRDISGHHGSCPSSAPTTGSRTGCTERAFQHRLARIATTRDSWLHRAERARPSLPSSSCSSTSMHSSQLTTPQPLPLPGPGRRSSGAASNAAISLSCGFGYQAVNNRSYLLRPRRSFVLKYLKSLPNLPILNSTAKAWSLIQTRLSTRWLANRKLAYSR